VDSRSDGLLLRPCVQLLPADELVAFAVWLLRSQTEVLEPVLQVREVVSFEVISLDGGGSAIPHLQQVDFAADFLIDVAGLFADPPAPDTTIQRLLRTDVHPQQHVQSAAADASLDPGSFSGFHQS